nr:capsid protein [Botryosphaeria dothidea partitivirus 2]
MSVAPSDSISNVPSAPVAESTTITVPSAGGSKKSRGRRGKNPSGAPRAPASSATGVPRPQHLSTVNTPTRDDPMLVDDFLVSGADSLAPVSIRPTVRFDNSGYMVLIEQVYSQIVLSNRNFFTTVPLPLFQYYCVMALWYRYLFLNVSYSRYSFDAAVRLESFRSISWSLPSPLKRYLDGIGEFRTPHGDLFRPAEPFLPLNTTQHGLNGFYGKFTRDSYYKYMTVPSPGVAVYNIIAAISRSVNVGAWGADLPAAVRPDPTTNGRWIPTKNILGFDPNCTLTSKQIQNLRNLGFDCTPTAFAQPAGNQHLPFHGPTCIFVSEALASLQGYKTDVFTNSSSIGTLSAGCFLSVYSPGLTRWVDGEFEVNSMFNCESRLSSAALLMAYRVKREPTDSGTCPFLPYQYQERDEETAPPAGYLANRNFVFADQQAGRLNHSWFETSAVDREMSIAEMSRAFKK